MEKSLVLQGNSSKHCFDTTFAALTLPPKIEEKNSVSGAYTLHKIHLKTHHSNLTNIIIN